MTSTLLAYYEDIGLDWQLKTAELWLEHWTKEGWTPLLLGPSNALGHPKLQALKDKAASLPTVNGRAYETACYVRWCAFANAAKNAVEPVVITDYDVFARELYPPRDYPDRYNGEPSNGPGWLVARPEDIEAIIDTILDYEPRKTDLTFDKPHVSDMIILINNPQLFSVVDPIIQCYNTPGWRSRPLVHFANGYLSHKLPKYREIAAVLHAERLTH